VALFPDEILVLVCQQKVSAAVLVVPAVVHWDTVVVSVVGLVVEVVDKPAVATVVVVEVVVDSVCNRQTKHWTELSFLSVRFRGAQHALVGCLVVAAGKILKFVKLLHLSNCSTSLGC
jgi:hypothetical protein